jgi:hypothetical protein
MSNTGKALVQTCVLLSCILLSGCAWLECTVLCERFYVDGLTNPKTGAHVTCGNFVQKGELTDSERNELDACVSEYSAKGYILDKKK